MAELLTAERRSPAPVRPQLSLASDPRTFFVALLVSSVGVALLAVLPNSILQDTWLALVDGRLIVHGGIPHHVVLTSLAHGRSWIDLQWLTQLCMYGLDRLGGLGLVGVVNVALIVAGLGGAAVAARRLGAAPRSVLWALLLPAIIIVFTNEVRTQAYAYPLFVTTVYLLAADSRRPSDRVYWCLPVLVLWANVHGSASLGAGLVALRGLTTLWERRRRLRDRAAWPRPLSLMVASPLALLATPYGIATISYYRSTLLAPGLHKLVTEWQPITASPVLEVMFFLLASAALWAMGRYRGSSTVWERCATVVLAAGAIIALRNVVWFALAMLVVLPAWIDRAMRARERPVRSRPRLNRALLATLGVTAVALAVRALTAGAATLTPSYPPRALATVRGALQAIPGARVYADETYADWLLWELPSLRGRVAYDASFEVLSFDQLDATYEFKTVTRSEWLRAARGYRVLVLDASASPQLVPALQREAGARVLYRRGALAVLER